MKKKYDLTKQDDYCELMEYFGGEGYLKKKFPLMYKAFQNSRIQDRQVLKQNNTLDDEDVTVGRQDILSVNLLNSQQVDMDEEMQSPMTMHTDYNYVDKKAVVVVDNTIEDENGVIYGGKTYVNKNSYSDSIEEPLKGIMMGKTYELHGKAVFTSFKQNEAGEVIVDTCEAREDKSVIYVNQGVEVVKNVTLIDPVNKYPNKSAQTYIVYGKRKDNNVSYQYKDVPGTEVIKGKKYAHIWCPFKIKIELNGYTFFNKEPLSNVDFSVRLESAEPDKYGGGGVVYNNFSNITTTLSENDTVLEIEIPVDWKASLTVDDINLVIGAFNFRACFKVNYVLEIAGQKMTRMTTIVAATEVIVTNSSVYVEPIKIRWGCFGKKSIFQKRSEKQSVEDIKVEEIKAGDKILSANGEFVTVTEVITGYEDRIINIQIQENGDMLQLSEAHGIQTRRGLIPAGDLRFEDEILTEDGSYLQPVYLAMDEYRDTVYDIKTEEPDMLIASGIVVAGKEISKSVRLHDESSSKLPMEFMEELEAWSKEKRGEKRV